MNRSVFLLTVSLMLFNSVGGHEVKNRTTLKLTVEAVGIGKELTFEGAVFFNTKDKSFTILREKTPYEIHADADFVAAIFRESSAQHDLTVRLFKNESMSVSGTAVNVVLGTGFDPRSHDSKERHYIVQALDTPK